MEVKVTADFWIVALQEPKMDVLGPPKNVPVRLMVYRTDWTNW